MLSAIIQCHFAQCCTLIAITQNDFVLSAVMLNVAKFSIVMQSVVRQNVIMPSAVAP